jgi:hypothetical protein
MALPDPVLVGAAELLDPGGLARGRSAGDDQAAAGADLALVEQAQQAALMQDLADRGGGHHDHFGVVGDPGLVIAHPTGVIERLDVRVGEEPEGGLVGVDEPPPAFQRGRGLAAVL